jgi:hypothetical protein
MKVIGGCNPLYRHPRESGDPAFLFSRLSQTKKLDSRFRGNDEEEVR